MSNRVSVIQYNVSGGVEVDPSSRGNVRNLQSCLLCFETFCPEQVSKVKVSEESRRLWLQNLFFHLSLPQYEMPDNCSRKNVPLCAKCEAKLRHGWINQYEMPKIANEVYGLVVACLGSGKRYMENMETCEFTNLREVIVNKGKSNVYF